MPIKIEGGWKCSICGSLHPRDVYALSCEQSHELVYIPIKQEDLLRLIQFLYTKDESLLNKSLVETLLKYSRRVG